KKIILFLATVFLCQAKGQIPVSQRLSDSINTKNHEYWPSITANDSILIFNRLINKDGYKNEDFYYSTKDSAGNWTEAKPLVALNTYENEGAQTISADGQFMIFTSCNHPQSVGSCDLFYSFKHNGEWTPARNLGETLNTRYWETQPSLSADGTELYFVSNRPGGKGGMDIWHCKLLGFNETGGMQWSEPENLNINTPKNEMSPFIHSDNETLYFSSDGYTKKVGLDVFVARKTGATFSTPTNIGSPVNTDADEMGFIVNAAGTTAYFSSDQNANNRDIYSFPLPAKFRPKKVQILQGKVLNSKDKSPVFATLSLYAQNDRTATYNTITVLENGQYLLCLRKGKLWHLSVQADGYLFHSERIDLQEEAPDMQQKNIELTPIEKNATLTLRNIFFDTDKATLKEESKAELQNVKQLLEQNPTLRIELSGHTDN
ncbi:MAG: flagellar motor protein MotB, partial [Bacteroidia bacterium]